MMQRMNRIAAVSIRVCLRLLVLLSSSSSSSSSLLYPLAGDSGHLVAGHAGLRLPVDRIDDGPSPQLSADQYGLWT
eukprot:3871173-Heterocapsa_arctica.AAC.1